MKLKGHSYILGNSKKKYQNKITSEFSNANNNVEVENYCNQILAKMKLEHKFKL